MLPGTHPALRAPLRGGEHCSAMLAQREKERSPPWRGARRAGWVTEQRLFLA